MFGITNTVSFKRPFQCFIYVYNFRAFQNASEAMIEDSFQYQSLDDIKPEPRGSIVKG